ncbi:MAG: pilus assembly protein [Actinomycetota bacterium]|nr:pilus assembly protein [Actinomycetota bacterium]
MLAATLRRARVRCGDDSGSALVEFTVLAVFLMVPLVYVILTVFKVQAASYGVAQAAREAGRAYVTTEEGADPWGRAFTAANIAMTDHDPEFTLAPGALQVGNCSKSPCLTPGGAITFEVTYTVPLPLIPEQVFGVTPASIPLRSTHVEFVDRFRGRGG